MLEQRCNYEELVQMRKMRFGKSKLTVLSVGTRGDGGSAEVLSWEPGMSLTNLI